MENEDSLEFVRKDLARQQNYADGLGMLSEMTEADYRAYAKLFSAFNSQSGIQILRYLAKRRLNGDKMVQNEDITEHVTDKFNFGKSRVSQNLNRFVKAEILVRKIQGRRSSFGFNEKVFKDILMSIQLLQKYFKQNGHRN